MSWRPIQIKSLTMIGAGRRIAIAVLIAAALWVGFFWAINTPGAL